MPTMNVYLNFAGDCEEALNFYKNCLGGDIISLQRFGDSPVPSDETHQNQVMHAEFKAGDVYLMASDTMPDMPLQSGNNITLNLNFSDIQAQAEVFAKLSAGGNVIMPLEDTFWGARFGMFVDKYGINWMTNCDIK
ncbi:MAG: VOC family protein [Microscillaceae bacterium]|nr:VOC family protein [Microscillaceae bacterium]